MVASALPTPHVTIDSHLLNIPYAHALVGVAGALSLAACTALWLHLGRVRLLQWRARPLSDAERRAAGFCSSHVGSLFLQLLVADTLQAVGFTITLNWAVPANQRWTLGDPAKACTLQGLLIQFADVAVALFSLAIALHTFAVLVLRRRLAKGVVLAASASIWLLDVVLAGIGPTIARHQLETRGPFYCGSYDSFCWISPFYEELRLPLHLVWILIASFGACVLYPVVLLSIARRPRHVLTGSSVSLDTSISRQMDARQRTDAVARRMQLFPLAWLLVSLPHIVVRLMQLRGAVVGPEALTLVGSIFALNGFVDVLLYSFTRRLVGLPATSRRSAATSIARITFISDVDKRDGTAASGSFGDDKSLPGLPPYSSPVLLDDARGVPLVVLNGKDTSRVAA